MRFLCGILTIAAVTACQPIPELAFVAEDASVADAEDATAHDASRADGAVVEDADVAPNDASDVDASDASGADASDASDASVADTSVADTSVADTSVADTSVADTSVAVCPSSPPEGASLCCDTVPCRGAAASCSSECTNCKNNCHGKTCCLDHNGNFQGCAASPADCQND